MPKKIKGPEKTILGLVTVIDRGGEITSLDGLLINSISQPYSCSSSKRRLRYGDIKSLNYLMSSKILQIKLRTFCHYFSIFEHSCGMEDTSIIVQKLPIRHVKSHM